MHSGIKNSSQVPLPTQIREKARVKHRLQDSVWQGFWHESGWRALGQSSRLKEVGSASQRAGPSTCLLCKETRGYRGASLHAVPRHISVLLMGQETSPKDHSAALPSSNTLLAPGTGNQWPLQLGTCWRWWEKQSSKCSVSLRSRKMNIKTMQTSLSAHAKLEQEARAARRQQSRARE